MNIFLIIEVFKNVGKEIMEKLIITLQKQDN